MLTEGQTRILEIIILWGFLYYLLRLLRGTRGAAVMTGLIVFMVTLLAIIQLLNLYTLSWLFQQFSVYLGIAFIIIFQPEIRRALAELGRQNVFASNASKKNLIDDVVQAVTTMSDNKIGALICIEREIGTRPIQETGVRLDSAVSPELLSTIFFPRTPLHDGGVIIHGNRIVAAGCVFPLTQNQQSGRSLGTRHRAALGITEETDSVVVIVSEETGNISLAYRGRLSRGLDEERLRRLISSILSRGSSTKEPEVTPGTPTNLESLDDIEKGAGI
ncbi:MAG: diadenylate cyclase [Kiritimatiellia bacterium]|jgi:diadenylate cyclase